MKDLFIKKEEILINLKPSNGLETKMVFTKILEEDASNQNIHSESCNRKKTKFSEDNFEQIKLFLTKANNS